ncbi:twitchin-like [Achroia grisella]|uniref:twitchin-like n=1 Tax=Achroia grisella TaxID=688607 RepID=UPI0027D1F1C7|nr:twitchin-like [Achroia grisella]
MATNKYLSDLIDKLGYSYDELLEIDDTLEDTIVNEGAAAVFECQIKNKPDSSSIWYKDGKEIHPSNRIMIINNRKWRRLEIDAVTAKDHGIYTIVFNDKYGMYYSSAKLIVNARNTKTIHTCPCPRWALAVSKCLKSIAVTLGERIDLEVEFNSEALTDYLWFKNDIPIVENDRIMILKDTTSSVLTIHCGKLSDTGIYTVVTKTKYGFASNTADVHVLEENMHNLNNNLFIEESPPDEVAVNEDDEVMLVFKIAHSVNIAVKWLKNDLPITQNKRLLPEYYYGGYVCLRILDTQRGESSIYALAIENEITGKSDISSCVLTINNTPMKNPPLVVLKKPLVSVITCNGSAISFHCSFELDDSGYYYVCWYVGHFRVERSNTRFNVVSKDGEFLLYIKNVEPGMNGEVICELRRALPNQKSVRINRTFANLTIVPAIVLETKMFSSISTLKSKIRYVSTKDNFTNGDYREYNEMVKDRNGNGHFGTFLDNQVALEITYCRLEEHGFHYFDVCADDFMSSVPVELYEEDLKETSGQHRNVVVIEWKDFAYPSMWYAIDLRQKNGDYTELGVSSSPKFEIKNPPIEKMMEFRIRTVADPMNETSECSICISPLPVDETPVTKSCNVKEMEEFESFYTKTDHLIGSGGFGSVSLVKDKRGAYYAAKVQKTKTQMRRETAFKEYEIMRVLKHPKIVELIDAFVAKDSLILVMNYCWGGELFDRIVQEDNIKEVDVVLYVRQICEALYYLHSHKIAHLDLKPENIICLSPNSRQVKIIDFGLARMLDNGNNVKVIYGTKDYIAPEILNYEKMTTACDMWTLGVVTYMLLSGVMPFAGNTWLETSANITMANYNYNDTAFTEISDLAKDFVDSLIILVAEKRMSAADALNHQWIVEGPPKGASAGHMMRTRKNMKSYLANYRARWQRAGNVMIAAHRLRTQASNRSSVEVSSHVTEPDI